MNHSRGKAPVAENDHDAETARYWDLVRLDIVGPAIAEATGETAWTNPSAELIAGGKSNLTFTLRSEVGEVILRRPPSGKLLPSAHDMAREARILTGLAGSEVPVPKVLLVDAEGEALGVPYYVMAKVEGRVIRDELPAGYAESEEEKARIADALVDALVALHRIDPAEVGLGDLGKPTGYLERQLDRWQRQSEKAAENVQIDEFGELARKLEATRPDTPTTRIVHGDFRLDNCILDHSDPGTVRAVLDWELSTLGDPLADLGLSLLYWGDSAAPPVPLVPSITNQPGWPRPDHLIERYCAATGADPALLDWYIAFSVFKFTAIAQGVFTRAAAGDMAGQSFDDGGGRELLRELVATGLDKLA